MLVQDGGSFVWTLFDQMTCLQAIRALCYAPTMMPLSAALAPFCSFLSYESAESFVNRLATDPASLLTF